MAPKDVESQQPSILSQGRTITLDFTDEQRRVLNNTLALISIIIYFSATSFVPIVNKAIQKSRPCFPHLWGSVPPFISPLNKPPPKKAGAPFAFVLFF